MFVRRDPGDVLAWHRPLGEQKGAKHTQTLKFRLLYVTDSTLKPIVGIVVTTSPICPYQRVFSGQSWS